MDNNNRQAWLVWVNLSPLRLNSLWPPESLVQWPSTSVRTPAWQKYITAYQYPPKCCWQILSKYINFSMKWCDKQKLHWLRDAEPIESQSTIIKKFILSSQILPPIYFKSFLSKNLHLQEHFTENSAYSWPSLKNMVEHFRRWFSAVIHQSHM